MQGTDAWDGILKRDVRADAAFDIPELQARLTGNTCVVLRGSDLPEAMQVFPLANQQKRRFKNVFCIRRHARDGTHQPT